MASHTARLPFMTSSRAACVMSASQVCLRLPSTTCNAKPSPFECRLQGSHCGAPRRPPLLAASLSPRARLGHPQSRAARHQRRHAASTTGESQCSVHRRHSQPHPGRARQGCQSGARESGQRKAEPPHALSTGGRSTSTQLATRQPTSACSPLTSQSTSSGP